jgi:hypothetical protein
MNKAEASVSTPTSDGEEARWPEQQPQVTFDFSGKTLEIPLSLLDDTVITQCFEECSGEIDGPIEVPSSIGVPDIEEVLRHLRERKIYRDDISNKASRFITNSPDSNVAKFLDFIGVDCKNITYTYRIVDGKKCVAVLISEGYGGQWSTNLTIRSDDMRDLLLFGTPAIIEAVEARRFSAVEQFYRSRGWMYFNGLCGRYGKLVVKWVPCGKQFIVEEYDGDESVKLVDDSGFKSYSQDRDIIISPGFGGGFSTWYSGDDSTHEEFLSSDPLLVGYYVREKKGFDAICEYINLSLDNDPDVYLDREIIESLVIETIPANTHFRIAEYDGNEYIEYLGELNVYCVD